MTSIKEIYQQKIAAKDFKEDPIQLKVIEAYERLSQQIKNDQPYQKKSSNSFLKKVINTLKKAEEKPEYKDPRGLYIYGEVGRGKTFLMDLFFEAVDVPKKRDHYYHFMQDIHTRLNDLTGQADPLSLIAKEYAKTYKLICLDEFHVIDITDAMILYRLLEAFIEEGIFFVTTSNRIPDDLYKNGLQRAKFLPAIEILKTRLETIPLDSDKDYRKRHLVSADVWFIGNESEQARVLTHKFEVLFDGVQDSVIDVINGHKFTMIKKASKACWFSFEEACQKPRAARDYIYLAQTFDTIFLSGLPQLDETMQSEARRFVIMVDEFYDQGVKLIVGAETTMDSIYQGDNRDLKFEFDRTLSRLIEMQSQDYLNKPKRR